MDYSIRKKPISKSRITGKGFEPSVRYVQKKSGGAVRSSLIFNLRSADSGTGHRIKVKGTLEG